MNTLSKTVINLRLLSKYKQLLSISSRNFAAKKNTKPSSGSDIEADKSKKTLRSNGNVSEEVDTPVVNQTQTKTQPQPQVGKVHIVNSVAGNKPPIAEDTISGRYAQTLFIVASKASELHGVYNDMVYIKDVYTASESFRTFAGNAGLNSTQINLFVDDLAKCGGFSNSTVIFLDLLGKNKRFMYINEIAQKYIKSYNLLSKEEKIKIISAHELSASQKNQVREALQANPENKDKQFIIDYEVNPEILGGLQMYSENKFMDLSLNSRVEKLKEEVNKMI